MTNELTVIAYYGLNANGFDVVAIKENHVLRMFDAGEITADPLVRQADAQALLDSKDAEIEKAVLAERERCAVLADSMQYARDHQPVNVAEAIRKGPP